MRSEKSIKNLIFSLSGNFINLLINFISRTYFIKFLGNEYLGVNALFTNILTILSLAELGVGSAITYCLYKPLADNDENKIKVLMKFYKKSYRIIALIIIILGIILSHFIDYFVNGLYSIENLKLIFILFVTNTSVSYLFSYKKTIIEADQKQYIVSIYNYTVLVLQNMLQILILYITKNFILYLMIQILATIFNNILISNKANKLYPFLKENSHEKIDNNTFNIIKKNISAIIFHKIGSMVVNSTDNILISKLINIGTVGIYSNYLLIINAVNGITGQFFYAITASIGNLGATESKDKLYDIFNKILFLNFWIYGFLAICLITLLNPFIELWIGVDMKLDIIIVIVIVLNFYISGIRKTTLAFRDALGLYWYDRYKPLIESLINLIGSILLAKKFGLIGIFIGTTISTISTSLWIEPLVLYKYGFEKNIIHLLDLFKNITKYTIIMFFALVINYNIANLVLFTPIINFIIKTIISIFIPNLIFILVFYNQEEFKWIISLIKSIIIKKIMKGKTYEENNSSSSK